MTAHDPRLTLKHYEQQARLARRNILAEAALIFVGGVIVALVLFSVMAS